jgi:hypothetical protein
MLSRAKARSLTRAVSLTNRNVPLGDDPPAAIVGVPLTLVLCERDDTLVHTTCGTTSGDSHSSSSGSGSSSSTASTGSIGSAAPNSRSSSRVGNGSPVPDWVKSAFQACPAGLASVLALQPLGVDDVGHLLEQLHFHPTFVEQFAQRIHTEARGNPLWLTLVLQAIAKRDHLTWQAGAQRSGWCFSAGVGFHTIKLPSEISAALLQRIERLPDRDKQLLQAAALIGVEFDVSILCELTRKEPLVVLRQLQRLEKEEQILVAATDAEDTVRFSSGGFVDALLMLGGLSRCTSVQAVHSAVVDVQSVLDDRDIVGDILTETTQLQRQYHLQIADVLAHRLKRGYNNFDKVCCTTLCVLQCNAMQLPSSHSAVSVVIAVVSTGKSCVLRWYQTSNHCVYECLGSCTSIQDAWCSARYAELRNSCDSNRQDSVA